ncbi:MAG: VTC domain-containing protein [Coriobacteriales bacterium]
MSTAIQTFKRKEIKYRLSPGQLRALEQGLRTHMRPDAYGRTLVSSMYWDTPERSLIGRSVESPLYKEKLRLRRYGAEVALDNGPVFLEVKKKYKGVVYKRRVLVSGRAAALLLCGSPYEEAVLAFPLAGEGLAAESLAPRNRQIGAEVRQLCGFYGELRPSMVVNYQRTAWELAPGSADAWTQLRVTVDEELGFRDLMGGHPERREPLLPAGEAVLEVKALGAMPRWLVDALEAGRILPGSFTKYGTAYRTLMREKAASTAA